MRRTLVVLVLLLALIPCVSRLEAATDSLTQGTASVKAACAPKAESAVEAFSQWLLQKDTAVSPRSQDLLPETLPAALCVRATCRFCPTGPCCLSSCSCCL